MNEDQFIFATARGLAALVGISEVEAEATITLFKHSGRWVDLRGYAARRYLDKHRTRRIESPAFGRAFELCYPTGAADARLIENQLNLPVLEAWRAASDLVSIGMRPVPGHRTPAALADHLCRC